MAYIDPSTGGLLFQVLAAGFAVLSGAALVFSRQIRQGIARLRRLRRERLGSVDGQSDVERPADGPSADGDLD